MFFYRKKANGKHFQKVLEVSKRTYVRNSDFKCPNLKFSRKLKKESTVKLGNKELFGHPKIVP